MRDSTHPGSSGDFFSAIVLLLTAGFVLQQSILIYLDARVPIAVSPALLPLFLGSCLFICSLILLIRALKNQKIAVLIDTIRENITNWFCSEGSDWKRVLGGIILLGAYVFLLIPIFEFWLSSSLFLFFIFLFLRAASFWKIGIVTIGTVGGVILLFQILFNVSLP